MSQQMHNFSKGQNFWLGHQQEGKIFNSKYLYS